MARFFKKSLLRFVDVFCKPVNMLERNCFAKILMAIPCEDNLCHRLLHCRTHIERISD